MIRISVLLIASHANGIALNNPDVSSETKGSSGSTVLAIPARTRSRMTCSELAVTTGSIVNGSSLGSLSNQLPNAVFGARQNQRCIGKIC